MDYSRNYLYIDPATQEKLRKLPILVAGLGIGSVFAELALRTGFMCLTICDGDQVSASNLNRQNYMHRDIGKNKAVACGERLRAISPEVDLRVIPEFLDKSTLEREIRKHAVVVNTIDFDAPEFELVSDFCKKETKLELFPINLGFGACLTLIDHTVPAWREAFPESGVGGLKRRLLEHIAHSPAIAPYLRAAGERYLTGPKVDFDPQLGVSGQLVAAMMVTSVVRFVSGQKVKKFPEFYYLDAHQAGVLYEP